MRRGVKSQNNDVTCRVGVCLIEIRKRAKIIKRTEVVSFYLEITRNTNMNANTVDALTIVSVTKEHCL